jgi:hypothetical protein
MPSAEVMAQAWHAAAEAASRAASALNDSVRHAGAGSPVARAQGDWVDEYERCEHQAEMIGLLSVDGDD